MLIGRLGVAPRAHTHTYAREGLSNLSKRWAVVLVTLAACSADAAPTETVIGTMVTPPASTMPAVPAVTTPTTPTTPTNTTPPPPPPATNTSADPAFTREALLAAQAMCAGDLFKDFQVKAQALSAAATAWSAAPADATALMAARTAWSDAMASWQVAELYRIGPAAQVYMGVMFPGAMNLRDEIYSYPVRDTCAIDQALSTQGYNMLASLGSEARGLGTFEYLAFNPATTHSCTGTAATALTMSFSMLSSMLPQRRAQYAAAVATDIATRADQLVTAWNAAFVDALTKGSAPYMSQAQALNALSDALFYVDREVKDYKIGRVINLTMTCMPMSGTAPAGVCGAEATESRYAKTSIDNVRVNLRAALRLFEGCGPMGEGLGIDAWLREVGAGMLADQMSAALREAIAAADALAALEGADPAAVMNLHAKVKAFTDLLKTQFLSVLELQQPPAARPETVATPTTPPPAGGTTGGAAGAGAAGRPGGTAGSGTPPPPRPIDGD